VHTHVRRAVARAMLAAVTVLPILVALAEDGGAKRW